MLVRLFICGTGPPLYVVTTEDSCFCNPGVCCEYVMAMVYYGYMLWYMDSGMKHVDNTWMVLLCEGRHGIKL